MAEYPYPSSPFTDRELPSAPPIDAPKEAEATPDYTSPVGSEVGAPAVTTDFPEQLTAETATQPAIEGTAPAEIPVATEQMSSGGDPRQLTEESVSLTQQALAEPNPSKAMFALQQAGQINEKLQRVLYERSNEKETVARLKEQILSEADSQVKALAKQIRDALTSGRTYFELVRDDRFRSKAILHEGSFSDTAWRALYESLIRSDRSAWRFSTEYDQPRARGESFWLSTSTNETTEDSLTLDNRWDLHVNRFTDKEDGDNSKVTLTLFPTPSRM